MSSDEIKWLKSRGYLHLTPKINLKKGHAEFKAKVTSEDFVAKHSFFPLIHYKIKERKYKKHPDVPGKRAHSYIDQKGKPQQTAKYRPIHYATHIDAMIFGYYAEVIAEKYNTLLDLDPRLKESITAYRKIPIDPSDPNSKCKGTIHFASEAFQAIKDYSAGGDCAVLMFDIKSFFSELNHDYLKECWARAIGCNERLPSSHYNVFQAATNFSYVLRDELRRLPCSYGKRTGFDEKQLSRIRKDNGIECFFPSLHEFRKAIKDKKLKIYNHPFRKNGVPVGIPQGLPISSVLANLYLLNFDKAILDQAVGNLEGYYRRYSDDILIICNKADVEQVKDIVRTELVRCNLRPSDEKTEEFVLRAYDYGKNGAKLSTFQVLKDHSEKLRPITYLGFQFYGYQTRIKSANLSKFHRKTIDAVKRKSRRIEHMCIANPHHSYAIFTSQVRKLSTSIKKDAKPKQIKAKQMQINALGEYDYRINRVDPKHKSNYISYVRRVSNLFGDQGIYRQILKRRKILHEAIDLHYKQRLQRVSKD